VEVLAELPWQLLREFRALKFFLKGLEAAPEIELVHRQGAGLTDVREIAADIGNGVRLQDAGAQDVIVGRVRQRRLPNRFDLKERQAHDTSPPINFTRPSPSVR
jgi:hypothetical protein